VTSFRRIVVAINPQAAFGKHASLGDTVISRLRAERFDVDVVQGSDFNDARDQLAARLTPQDALLVIGGDGMVSMAVNLVAERGIPFAVMPAGTGNDFARGLNMPVHDLPACLDLVVDSLRSEPTPIDLARVRASHEPVGARGVFYACVLSAGFDAFVNERANRMRFPRGRSRYTWAILFELIGLKARSYTLTVDGVTRHEQGVLISVANNRNMGGGMIITPDASITDGLLDVFIVRPVSRLRLVRLLPRVFRGDHISEPEVHIEQARKVRIDSPGIVGYADGERLSSLPLEVEVVPGAALLLRAD
jgi:diacylglycerol kinase (ATP)